MKDNNFDTSMVDSELSAWQSFVHVVQNFLGNHKAKNYEELVESLLMHFQALGNNMRVKVHYLYSHLDNFHDKCGDYID